MTPVGVLPLAVTLAVSVTGIPAPAETFEELSVVTEVTATGSTVNVASIFAKGGLTPGMTSESVSV
jgi:hypothetical protein